MSDLKEKIKAEIDSQIWINEGDYSSIIDGKQDAANGIADIAKQYASERAVAFAKWCDTEGFYPTKDNKWQSAEYPWIRHSDRTDAELYALFVEETKTK